jgi:site-specific DNA-methyltransferase (adenine-specific)
VEPYYDQDGITIFNADCRDVLPTIDPATVNLVLTDPPYGIALEEHGRNGYDWTVAGDQTQELGQAVLDYFKVAGVGILAFASPKKPWAGAWRQHLVWDKGPAVGGGGDPKTCWKSTWELIQTWNTGILNGPRDSAVLRFWVGQRDYHFHPCQKPVSLLAYLIEKTTKPGDLIVDPFMGSGSVARACLDTGRRYVGIEIHEPYVQIAVKRLSQAVLPLEIPA